MLGARTFLSTKLGGALQQALRQSLQQMRRVLLPPACVLCGKPGQNDQLICTNCAPAWPDIDPATACPRCGKADSGGQVCGHCQRHPPPWEYACVPFAYATPVDDLLRQFKFHNRLAAGRLLSERWIDAVQPRQQPLPAAVIPVPLHPQRLRERGYNQSLELLRTLAPRLGVPILAHAARRVRATPAQIGLSARDRQHNLDGAFVIEGRLPRHIALFDDVITTGSTLSELARIARAAGAETIEVWAIARTAPEHRFHK